MRQQLGIGKSTEFTLRSIAAQTKHQQNWKR
jgi:hypothetical protein